MRRTHQLFLALGAVLCLGWESPRPAGTISRNEHLVMAVLWVQTSAELRALSYQAFNIAALKLDRDRVSNTGTKKRAVVVDIDETVLDNSPHMAKLIADNETFPYAWTDWVNRADAEPLPGAVEFLDHAVSQGYDVFYVSNRSEKDERAGTIRNLKEKGFPQVREDRVLLMAGESSKDARRRKIEETHEIVLLIGDNLNDHAGFFEKQPVDERRAAVDQHRAAFGDRYVVLPNPMYGEWEGAVYRYRRELTDAEKREMRNAALRGF